MLYPTTITQKWQMTLPKTIRESLGLEKPGKVFIQTVDKKKKLLRIVSQPTLLDLAGSLPPKNKHGQKLDAVKIREYMEKHYKRL